MKIKLAILIDVLEDVKGGAERQVYELITRIDKSKFDVFLYILQQKTVPKELAGLDCRVEALGVKRIYALTELYEGIKFTKFLKNEKINILMTYHFGSDIWGAFFGRKAGVPFIISNRRDMGFWRKKIHVLAYRLINRWVDKIVVVSNAVKEVVLREERLPEEKVEVIYNGVDIERFRVETDAEQIKRDFKIPRDSKIIGSVGNLRPIKGHIYLIKAARTVITRYLNAHFFIIGEGKLKNNLGFLAKNLGINSNIHFLGKRDDVPELLSIMDICVLPSLSEGLSNTLLEYMAAGKPIIATSVGGNSEVITDGLNGILILPEDNNALADKIITLIDNPDLRLKLGQAAKEKIEESFSIEKMIKQYENLFEELALKNKIRVCHLVSSNGFFGAEKVLLDLASGMNYDGLKQYIAVVKNLYNPHLELAERAQEKGIPTFIVEARHRFDLQPIKQLSRFIKENNIGILHTHNYKANFLGLLAAKRARIPIVATNHLWTQADLKLRFYEFIDAFILRYFINKVVAVSDSIKKDMLNRGVPASKIDVILNAVEEKTVDSKKLTIRDELKINQNTLVIGIVGRLSPEKGHRYFFEALKNVLKTGPNLVVLVVGEGSLRNELKSLVMSLDLRENVVFTGYQKDMDKVYRGIDILVQSSLREGLPITLLEAMTYGKPIIATGVGGTTHLIKDTFTGLLIKPGQPSEIEAALLKLIKDSSLREMLGRNAKQFVRENYSLEKMVDSYRNVYEEVL